MTKQRLFSLSPAAPERFRAQGIALDVVQSTGSTNDDLKEYLKSAAQPVLPRVRLAYEQTAGRGTRGHRWHNVTDAMLSVWLFPVCLLKEQSRSGPAWR